MAGQACLACLYVTETCTKPLVKHTRSSRHITLTTTAFRTMPSEEETREAFETLAASGISGNGGSGLSESKPKDCTFPSASESRFFLGAAVPGGRAVGATAGAADGVLVFAFLSNHFPNRFRGLGGMFNEVVLQISGKQTSGHILEGRHSNAYSSLSLLERRIVNVLLSDN